MQYMSERPNEIVYLSKMAADLKIESRQARNAIYNLRNTKRGGWEKGLETIVGGDAWRWNSDVASQANSSGQLFEQVGVRKNGDILIEDENGKLYRAVPMKED
jgi:hypothetical protein